MKRRLLWPVYCACLVCVVGLSTASAAVAVPATYRISSNLDGLAANGHSSIGNTFGGIGAMVTASISSDNRYVVFISSATDLVAGSGSNQNVFLRDRQTGKIELISRSSSGQGGGNADSMGASISANGRFVVFESKASDLVANDGNGNVRDLFVYDRETGKNKLVSVKTGGGFSNDDSSGASISADGRFVTFFTTDQMVAADTNGFYDCYVRDLVSEKTKLVSIKQGGPVAGNDHSFMPAISADGRYVVFASYATNLVPSDLNPEMDVFRYNVETGVIDPVSVLANGSPSNGGSYLPSISADGRYVTFTTFASNLVAADPNTNLDVYRKDLQTGTNKLISIDKTNTKSGDEGSALSAISEDGRFITFASQATDISDQDTNGFSDIFIRDAVANKTDLVSVNKAGISGNENSLYPPAISPDGRYVVFGSFASDLTVDDNGGYSDVFVRRLGDGVGPSAVATAAPSGADVSFSGEESFSPDGLTLTYEWNFGDGSSSQGKAVSHRYAQSGSYQVSLTVTDSEGLSATKTVPVTVTVPSSTQTLVTVTSVDRLGVIGGIVRISRRGIGSVKVLCPKTAAERCSGKLRLLAKLGKKTVVVATKGFTIAQGKTAKVSFRLTKRALRTIKKTKRKTLRAKASAVTASKANAASSTAKTVVLRFAAKKR